MKEISCPGGPYGAPVTSYSYDTSNCNDCPDAETSNFTPTCPAGQVATPDSGERVRTYSCSTGSAVGTTTVTNAGECTATTPCKAPTEASFTPTCGAGMIPVTNSGTKTTTYSCTTGAAVSTTVTDPGECQCPDSTTSQFTPTCQSGYVATVNSGEKTTSYNCSTGKAVASTAVTDPGECTATCTSSYVDQAFTPTCAANETPVANSGVRRVHSCPSSTETLVAGTCNPPPQPSTATCSTGSSSDWETGSHQFCAFGTDMVPANSTLSIKCGGQNTVQEVEVVNKTTGSGIAGYACSIGSTTIYSYSGSKKSLP